MGCRQLQPKFKVNLGKRKKANNCVKNNQIFILKIFFKAKNGLQN